MLMAMTMLLSLSGCKSVTKEILKDKVIGKIPATITIELSDEVSVEEATGEDVVPAEAPYGPKISSISKKGIEYYWKKPEHCDGYEVYRSYKKNGIYEMIRRIEKRGKNTFIDDTFDHEKRLVYYTVRSFLYQSDGTCAYSELIEPVEAVYIEKLTLEREVTYMYEDATRTIRALAGWGEPEDAQWLSDDPGVARVDEEGNITSIAKGTCTITCTSDAMGQSVSGHVIVGREAPIPSEAITSRYHYNEESGLWINPDADVTNHAVITMAGDLMCSGPQINAARIGEETYDFRNSFLYVKPVFESSDLAVGNLETLLASSWPYMSDEAYIDNMNNCNAPSTFLEAVRYAGFDAVALANNHNCDGGPRAALDTIAQVDRYELAHMGLNSDEEEARYFIAEVNGIRVGFLAYMSEDTTFNGKDKSWSEEDKQKILNVFTPEKAEKEIRQCKEAGAEYVIVYMHWGKKNYRNITEVQAEEALACAEAGADYIVGANPHLIQFYDEIETRDGRMVPCFYSTGNFLSVMDQVPGNRDSVIIRLELDKNDDGQVMMEDQSYIPVFTCKKLNGAKWVNVPVCEDHHGEINLEDRREIYDRITEWVGEGIRCE